LHSTQYSSFEQNEEILFSWQKKYPRSRRCKRVMREGFSGEHIPQSLEQLAQSSLVLLQMLSPHRVAGLILQSTRQFVSVSPSSS